MLTTNRPPVPGCRWATDHLLVRVGKAAKVPLPQALLRRASSALVPVAVNLLSKREFLHAGDDAFFGPQADALGAQNERLRRSCPRMSMFHVFWPEPGELPTARQVRQAIDMVEDAHAAGLRVLINGVGHPARAAIVAGCWLAREGHSGNLEGQRLHWLEDGADEPAGRGTSRIVLGMAERAFVRDWPTGRASQPDLADMAWSERDEVFPLASVEHWLRMLPTVRVYAGTRVWARPVDVPVVGQRCVSDGGDIDLDLEELRRGTWIGERTLRLTNGWQVVFVSPFR